MSWLKYKTLPRTQKGAYYRNDGTYLRSSHRSQAYDGGDGRGFRLALCKKA